MSPGRDKRPKINRKSSQSSGTVRWTSEDIRLIFCAYFSFRVEHNYLQRVHICWGRAGICPVDETWQIKLGFDIDFLSLHIMRMTINPHLSRWRFTFSSSTWVVIINHWFFFIPGVPPQWSLRWPSPPTSSLCLYSSLNRMLRLHVGLIFQSNLLVLMVSSTSQQLK